MALQSPASIQVGPCIWLCGSEVGLQCILWEFVCFWGRTRQELMMGLGRSRGCLDRDQSPDWKIPRWPKWSSRNPLDIFKAELVVALLYSWGNSSTWGALLVGSEAQLKVVAKPHEHPKTD